MLKPLSERKIDWVLIGFFSLNLLFITYIVDLEQLVIADPSDFDYPLWPPARLVDLVHWWGRTFDPLLMARPVWWRATIWIDAIFFGPFYAFALYAFWTGKEWIRIPSLLWSAAMMTNVTIIMSEEYFGPYATPAPGIVTMANAPWFLFPVLVIWRMRREHPFSEIHPGPPLAATTG